MCVVCAPFQTPDPEWTSPSSLHSPSRAAGRSAAAADLETGSGWEWSCSNSTLDLGRTTAGKKVFGRRTAGEWRSRTAVVVAGRGRGTTGPSRRAAAGRGEHQRLRGGSRSAGGWGSLCLAQRGSDFRSGREKQKREKEREED